MHLVPRELDALIVYQAGFVAQRRLARGIKLNHSEATALISCVLLELIRDGKHSVSDLMALGRQILGRRHVDPSVLSTLVELQVEGTFKTGVHLVTVDIPISTDNGDLTTAMYGSFLPVPSNDDFPPYDQAEYEDDKMPGFIFPADGQIELSQGRERIKLPITNTGDRPVQVGSHYHLIEANPQLDFDRLKAYGYHLDIPAGTSVRFEPGVSKTVTAVAIAGSKTICGGSGIASGVVDTSRADEIIARLKEGGFLNTPQPPPSGGDERIEAFKMSRRDFATMFGPTVGDIVRLSTMDLWVKVEHDLTVHGDECTFGGGKTIRDGLAQASGRSDADCLDLVITNALVVDWSGIFKADIGVKGGVIVGLGKAGNPDIMDGVTDGMVVGANTDVVAGEGKIVTAGGLDTHCHAICPQQAEEAIASGITTMFTGGTGPSTGTVATNCTPGKYFVERMMKACDTLPVNFGIIGKGNDVGASGLHDICNAGVVGLKIHEDWGSTPTVIDTALSVCDEFDIQCELHSDSLNEAGFVERTAAAFKGRTIHCYHIEGAGGGHAPDVITLVQQSNVLPSSTNPTLPYTTDTVEEHLDMLMTCHHLSKDIPEDIAFAESRIRAETIGAEDILHDLGAISMVSSDSQAMGRCGEVVLRTWNTAQLNKVQRGPLPEDEGSGADNLRVKRYVSKYTINPAITQGVAHIVGDVSVGKLADLVVWDLQRFGSKPALVLKSGWIASAQMGTPNGSIPGVQPVISRPMFAALSPSSSVMFVSQAGISSGAVASYGLGKRIEAVKNCRKLKKQDMKFNGATPEMSVDPELFKVTADGKECKGTPTTWLPLAQQHFLS